MDTEAKFEELADNPLHPPEEIGEWDIEPGIVATGDRWSPDRSGCIECIWGYGRSREELWLGGNSDDGWTVTYLTYNIPDDVDVPSGVGLEEYEEGRDLSHHDDLGDAAAALVKELSTRT